MDSLRTDVLIVGLGTAALSLAIELGRREISCTLIRDHTTTTRWPDLQYANSRARDHLHRWGINSPLAAGKVNAFAPHRRHAVLNAPEACFSLSELNTMLLSHARQLPSVKFLDGVEVLGFEQGLSLITSVIGSCPADPYGTVTSQYLILSDRPTAGRGYRDGRICVFGNHRLPAQQFASYAANEALEDGVDLGWKLAASIRGWGGQRLLDTYQIERGPLHQRMRRRRTSSQSVSLASVGLDSPIVVQGQQAIGARRCIDPGAPAPHFFLLDGTSLHEVLGPEYTLLSTGGWATADLLLAQEEARAMGFPLTLLRAPAPALAALYGARLILIRPDRRVAWWGDAWPYEGQALLRQVAGH